MITNDTVMPFARTSLLLAIQRTLIGEYGEIIVPSEQEVNAHVKARIHSNYDPDRLYIQFRFAETKDRKIKPESLVAAAEECKSKLEDAYKRDVSAAGKLCPCSDEIKIIEF